MPKTIQQSVALPAAPAALFDAHVNVADHDCGDVNQGWETYYWSRWRAYLERR